MSRTQKSVGLYDDSVIDGRKERPLTIAFATILFVWMMAFGIFFVSAQLGAQSHHMAQSQATSSIEK